MRFSGALAVLLCIAAVSCEQKASVSAPPARGAATPSPPGPLTQVEYVPPTIQDLTARTLRTFKVPEANQGVAADTRHFYAVDDTVIAKYEIASGRRVGEWAGPLHGLIRHLNSCFVDGGRLVCTNSNYSLTPMGSSVEMFDAASMQHLESHSFGMLDEGSLTWLDKYRAGWMAGFAHYDGNGGLPFKDHRFSSVVTYDSEWRRTGGWLLPTAALERMAPYAASGGAIGPDGWLYLLGHDRPEMYVVARPPMGPTLIHVATIALEAEGQAFAWAQDGSRTVLTIDRRRGLVRMIELPVVTAADPTVSLKFR
jgi:hypothetical protein